MMGTIQSGDAVAAIDLGSNSFRLEISLWANGQLSRLEYLKEPVRIGGGLDLDRKISSEAISRGVECLGRFAERVSGLPSSRVRAVATQSFREASNQAEALSALAAALGQPIEVISGREEARLIYQGVTWDLPPTPEQRMVIDVGGRSTELIVGRADDITVMESYRIGSIAWSLRYFPHGQLARAAIRDATLAATAVLDEIVNVFPQVPQQEVYGSAGTFGAIADILERTGWAADTVSRDGLRWLMDRMVESRHIDRLNLEGLRDDRRPVLAGGACVIFALFDLLKLDQLKVAKSGLRHGVLREMLAADHPGEQLRQNSITRLADRFGVDRLQARRVERAALHVFGQISLSHATQTAPEQLRWAAQLHELGRHISHSDFHKHGAYVLGNADVPGFAQNELRHLGQLVLGQRGKLKKLDLLLNDPRFVDQLVALRVALILCHARVDPVLDSHQFRRTGSLMELSVPASWANKHPQSYFLLSAEAEAWCKGGLDFRIHTR